MALDRDVKNRLIRALSVESNREIPRTRVVIEDEDGFRMIIYGEDTHALRAALNSYLRWIDLALKVEEVIDDGRELDPHAPAED